jgi:hypothetical protein
MRDGQAEMPTRNVTSHLPKHALGWKLWYTKVGR